MNASSCSAFLASMTCGLGLGGGVLQLVLEVLAGDVVLGVGALDLVLHGLLGPLLVALDLRGGEPVLLLELLALLRGSARSPPSRSAVAAVDAGASGSGVGMSSMR